MFKPGKKRLSGLLAWWSVLLLAIGLGALLLAGAASPAWAGEDSQREDSPAGQTVAPNARPRFVRGGVFVRLQKSPYGELVFRAKGKPAAARYLPSLNGWLLEVAWSPREKVLLSWTLPTKGSGETRSMIARAPLKPEPLVLRKLAWPPVSLLSTGAEDRLSALALDETGALLAAGSQQGRVAVFSVADGKKLWSMERPGRVIKHLAFSGKDKGQKGSRLIVAEQGPEGRLAAYNWRRGGQTPLWVLDTANELGKQGNTNPGDPHGWITLPGSYALTQAGGYLWAVYTHSWTQQESQANSDAGSDDGLNAGDTTMRSRRRALARLYRVEEATGKLSWAYPATAPARMMMTWFSVTPDGGRVALPLQLPAGASEQATSRVLVLAAPASETAMGNSGSSASASSGGKEEGVLFNQAISAEPPRPFAGFWRGVGLRPDGKALAVATEDGRGFLFQQRNGAWEQTAALRPVKPMRMAGVPVTATNGTLAATQREVIFATGPSYLPKMPDDHKAGGSASLTMPLEGHPNGNTLFAHDWGGKARWLWRMGSDLQGLAVSPPGGGAKGGNVLALLLGSEAAQKPGDFNGVVLMNLEKGETGGDKLQYRLPFSGRAVYGALTLSANGRRVAVGQAPRLIKGDPRPIGKNAIWVIR